MVSKLPEKVLVINTNLFLTIWWMESATLRYQPVWCLLKLFIMIHRWPLLRLISRHPPMHCTLIGEAFGQWLDHRVDTQSWISALHVIWSGWRRWVTDPMACKCPSLSLSPLVPLYYLLPCRASSLLCPTTMSPCFGTNRQQTETSINCEPNKLFSTSSFGCKVLYPGDKKVTTVAVFSLLSHSDKRTRSLCELIYKDTDPILEGFSHMT